MGKTNRSKYSGQSGKNLRYIRHIKSKDGSDYTEEQIEFMMAVDKYKTDNNRPYPTWVEVLQIARLLGYEREL